MKILSLLLIASFMVISPPLIASGSSHNQSNNAQFESTQVSFKLPEGWILGEVAAIERRANGNFIIFHRGQHQLLEFDKNHEFVREIGANLFKTPHGLRLDSNGNLWTTDSGTHLVLRFSTSGKVTMVLGKSGLTGTGWFDKDRNVVFFNEPLDVGFDKAGNIYVVDKGNARIVKFNPDGNLLKTWGKQGTKLGEFNFVHSIVIDDNDKIYIADRENKRIQLFNVDGNAQGEWKNIGYPYVLMLSEGSLWVTDARFEMVRELSLKGKVLRSYKGEAGRNPGQYSSVHGIHVNSKGHIWVTQIFNWGGVNRLQSK